MIDPPIANKEEIKRYLFKTNNRIINKILRKYHLFEKKVYEEGKDFKSAEELYRIKSSDFYLRGYFKEEYFKIIKEELIKEIELKNEYKRKIKVTLKKIKRTNSVSINVRRGDLLVLRGHILPLEYYIKSVNIIKNKIKKPKFYIFSDDINWCKKNLRFIEEAFFIEGNEAYEDLELMKNCKHNILANSLLSWWAAYLNKNKNKIIICPKYFTHYLPNNLDKNADKNPKEWTRVDYEIASK